MDTNLIFGAFALLFGSFTAVARFVAPKSFVFAKLGPMRERYGHGPGTALHVLAYTVSPLVVGATLVASAWR